MVPYDDGRSGYDETVFEILKVQRPPMDTSVQNQCEKNIEDFLSPEFASKHVESAEIP